MSKVSEEIKLKKLYKKSARHWFWQILGWKITGNYTILPCPFCDEVDSMCETGCKIDIYFCNPNEEGDLFGEIIIERHHSNKREMYRLARKLRREFKIRAKS